MGVQINQISIFLGAREIKQGKSTKGVAKGEASESYVVDRNYIVAALARFLNKQALALGSGRLTLHYSHKVMSVFRPSPRDSPPRPIPPAPDLHALMHSTPTPPSSLALVPQLTTPPHTVTRPPHHACLSHMPPPNRPPSSACTFAIAHRHRPSSLTHPDSHPVRRPPTLR